MVELAEKDRGILEAAFYDKPFYFSYSSLNKLLEAPNIFYREYILKDREPKTQKHLLEGTLIHYLVLENLNFDDKFVIVPDDLPSENSIRVAYSVFEIYKKKVEEDPIVNSSLTLADFESDVMTILEEMNLHQKVGEDKRAKKIIEPKTEAYFEYLKLKGKREIIDSGMLDKCTAAADIIKSNSGIRELLGLDVEPDGVNFGVYNELELDMEIDGYPFGLKGVIDNLVVDVKSKLVRINDFKTTSKTLEQFPESVEYWKYWLQGAIYLNLAMEFLKDVVTDEWSFEIRFIVFDKYDQIYAFPVSPESIAEWVQSSAKVIEQASYHYENKDYTLPYKFIAGDVIL